MMSPHGSSTAENEKMNVVKDKKYKSAFRNRSSAYIKESGGGALPDDNEKEICTQLRNISLVKDSSKTFTPAALKDLVERLGTRYVLEESDGNKMKQVSASKMKQVSASKESPSSSQERPKEFNVQTLGMEFNSSGHTNGEDSYIYPNEPHNFSIFDDETSDVSDDEESESESSPPEEDFAQRSGGEALKNALDEQSVSEALLCDSCQSSKWMRRFSRLGNDYVSGSIPSRYKIFKQERMEDYSRRKSLLRMNKRNSNVGSSGKLTLPTVCGSCEDWFDSDGETIAHFGAHHFKSAVYRSDYWGPQTPLVKRKKRVYRCLICSYRSRDLAALNRHRKDHTSGKPLSCDLYPNKTSRVMLS